MLLINKDALVKKNILSGIKIEFNYFIYKVYDGSWVSYHVGVVMHTEISSLEQAH